MIVFCTRCWAQNRQGARTCYQCGEPLQPLAGGYVDKLVSALHHPESETVQMAAWVLGERRESAATAALLELLESTNELGALEAAVEALGKIGDPRAVPVLHKHGAWWPLRVRLSIIVALGRIGGAEAEVVLQKLAQSDPSLSVRHAAQRALIAQGKDD